MTKKRYDKKPSKFMSIEKRLVESKAYLSLSGFSAQLYMLFKLRCVVEPVESGKPGKHEPEWVITNNGDIVFTYKTAKARYGVTSSRFVRAIDDLILKGFLDINETGMGVHKQTTKYTISERWRKYGTNEFERAERQKAAWNPGTKNLKTKKKSSNEIVTETSNENVTYGRFLVLKTDAKGKVKKYEFKYSDDKWLKKKIS